MLESKIKVVITSYLEHNDMFERTQIGFIDLYLTIKFELFKDTPNRLDVRG